MSNESLGSSTNSPDEAPENIKRQVFTERCLEYFDKVDDLTETATKMIFTVNGGALVAILALIAQLYATNQTELAKAAVYPGVLFLIGLNATVFAVLFQVASLMPLALRRYGEEEKNAGKQRWHMRLRFIRGGMFLLAIAMLTCGSVSVGRLFF